MNGSESHSSAIDEFNSRQLLCKDGVEALERGVDRDKGVPSPSMGWFGSYLSLSFLSSNATSSSDIGCGAVDMLHQIGGLVYRAMKCETFRAVVEARAGVANFIRLMRVAFIAAHLNDIGEKELKLPKRKKKHADAAAPPAEAGGVAPTEDQDDVSAPSQPFVVCVNEILKKNGLTHTLFTRALQNLSGRIKEPQLLGTLVDAERHAEDPRTRRPFVDPEGFPNSYVRGASHLFCRVGVQVEAARDSSSQGQASAPKGIQMQAYAEPVIPDGGIAFGGPITVRVVENEGSFREYVKDLSADGSRRDWGATFLHAKPVTSAKAQTAASGAIEASTTTKETSKPLGVKLSTLDELAVGGAFTDTDFHTGGYQAIELIRLTNLTPLLWVRVDPAGLYGGRISVVQPDACLAEQLFHDGDASAQIEAIRALAERPLRIQASGKVTTVYDVNVSELPVRVLGDCLRGSPALHSSLPHTPAVRAQAALSIAQVRDELSSYPMALCFSLTLSTPRLTYLVDVHQWQNNKAPQTKDAVGAENWVGINILIQYFRERFYSSAMVMPVKFFRLVLKKSDEEARQANTAADGGLAPSLPSFDSTYEYLDTLDEDEMKEALEAADSVEVEEDEEYRVRSVVVAAVSSIRAKDGYTPPLAIQFLETVLESEDAEMAGNLVYDSEQLFIEDTFRKANARFGNEAAKSEESEKKSGPSLTYVSSQLVADALLAICQINSTPMTITDSTGKIASKGPHPLMRLLRAASSWLEWELYRESIRLELEKDVQCGISGNSQNVIAACAVLALSNVAILIQSTTDDGALAESNNSSVASTLKDATSAKFYTDIFDSYPHRNDLTRAACAQALSCICCAADRLEKENSEPVGLLTAFEFLLDRILGKWAFS